jgi:hypothetical protein
MQNSKYIKTVFWNVGNLFDTTGNEISTDFEFTEERGYNGTVKKKKIEYLAKGIKLLKFNKPNVEDNDPDLIGFCEVENNDVLKDLVDAINPNKYDIASYNNSPDLRGIDTCLVYSKEMFDCLETKGYDIDFRYPTRDIFYVHLKVKSNNADLHVLVNHWPSRVGKILSCQPNDTAQARNTVGERCGKIVDEILKFDRKVIDRFPTLTKISKDQNYLEDLAKLYPDKELEVLHDNNNNQSILKQLDDKWNSNLLVMGDFNDEPYDESVSRYLGAVSDIRQCRELIEIFELRERGEKIFQDTSYKRYYLEEKSSLFNCMWKLMGDPKSIHYDDSLDSQYSNIVDADVPGGSLYYWKNNTWSIFDQFIISRGLYHGKQKLQMDIESIRISYKGLRLIDKGNLSQDKFDDTPYHTDRNKVHPILKNIPFSFAYIKNKYDDEQNKWIPNPNSLHSEEEPNKGFSDHFPIQCLIEIL